MGRKKKQKKGIESIKKQIIKHKEKLSQVSEDNPLYDYWKKEIKTMEREIDKKERIVKRKK